MRLFGGSWASAPTTKDVSLEPAKDGSSITAGASATKADDTFALSGGAGLTLFNDGGGLGASRSAFVGGAKKSGDTTTSMTVHAARTNTARAPAPIDSIGVSASRSDGSTTLSGKVEGQYCAGYTRAEASVAASHKVNDNVSITAGASKGTDTPASGFFGISFGW